MGSWKGLCGASHNQCYSNRKAGEAELGILEVSAILHDAFRYKEDFTANAEFKHELKASREARQMLPGLGFSKEFIDAVCYCIETHRKTGSSRPGTLEAMCIFDADKLDSIWSNKAS